MLLVFCNHLLTACSPMGWNLIPVAELENYLAALHIWCDDCVLDVYPVAP